MKILFFASITFLATQLFAQGALGPEEAVEVAWKALGRSPGKNSFLVIDREENRNGKDYFVLQGYSRNYDRNDGTSNTANWGWFFVDAKTGETFEWNMGDDELLKVKSAKESASSPPKSLHYFLDSWFGSIPSNDAHFVGNHYADMVDSCYIKGLATKRKLMEDHLQFTKKFPTRNYSELNLIGIQPDGSGGFEVEYSFRYSYTGTKSANGRAKVSISVKQFGGEWKITRFHETTSRL